MNEIHLNINSKKVTLNESDILNIIPLLEGYFDGSDPLSDFYFAPLIKVMEKIHDKDSPFWTEYRLSKVQ